MNYLYYLVIFTTGLCSLVYQVVWQRYLHLLVGSEARSTTIIVAIFLLGLSLGYYLFGRLSLRYKDRNQFLKFYGYIEVATGAYAILFPKLFEFINNSGLANTSSLAVDIFVGLLLLLFPTVLMGATVPIMTTVLPNTNEEVNRGHAIIYGVNTLGAFLGVLVSSFILIPKFGLSLTLTVIGGINFFCGLIYMGNRLTGTIKKQAEIPTVPSNYRTSDVYLLAFTSGLVTISLEIIWIRLMGLSIGSSFFVFPLVLSLFILGLGLGSLSMKSVTVKALKVQYHILLFFLIISYFFAPYIPLWLSNIRVSLGSWISSYYLFLALTYLFVGVFFLTFIFPLGRLLPMSYAFLKKDAEQYGFNCGMLYFVNTVGTFVGSVVFSYLLFYFFSIETVYKLNIIILAGTFALLFYRDKLYRTISVSALCVLLVLIFGEWNRRFHVQGVFRNRKPSVENFRGIFKIHPFTNEMNLVHMADGPNTTVGVISEIFTFEDGQKIKGQSIFVNGKSDSSTTGDYSTLALLGVIPYAFAEKATDLNTAVIGQGTGVTAGLLGTLEDVSNVDLIEISPAVADTLPLFAEFNYDAHKNPKIKSHELDAFKFFRQTKDKYDVVISEPTNPWVVGVENLFTPYFYNLISEHLNEGGILMQWVHVYSMDKAVLNTVFNNARSKFPYVELYQTGFGDLGLIASKKPINHPNAEKRLGERALGPVYRRLNIDNPKAILLTRALSSKELRFLAENEPSFIHSLEFPTLGMRAYESFFLGAEVNIEAILDPYIARLLNFDDQDSRAYLIKDFKSSYQRKGSGCRSHTFGVLYDVYCVFIKKWLDGFEAMKGDYNIQKKLFGYSMLRKEKFLKSDRIFLESVRKKYFSTQVLQTQENLALLTAEYVKEGWYGDAYQICKEAFNKKIIGKIPYEKQMQAVKRYQNMSQRLFGRSEWYHAN